jgi:hypothetical protein
MTETMTDCVKPNLPPMRKIRRRLRPMEMKKWRAAVRRTTWAMRMPVKKVSRRAPTRRKLLRRDLWESRPPLKRVEIKQALALLRAVRIQRSTKQISRRSQLFSALSSLSQINLRQSITSNKRKAGFSGCSGVEVEITWKQLAWEVTPAGGKF